MTSAHQDLQPEPRTPDHAGRGRRGGQRADRRTGRAPGAAGANWWSPVRVIAFVTIGMFALGMVQKLPCYDRGWFSAPAAVHPRLLLRHPASLHRARLR